MGEKVIEKTSDVKFGPFLKALCFWIGVKEIGLYLYLHIGGWLLTYGIVEKLPAVSMQVF